MKRGRLGPNQRKVMNVMVDVHSVRELGEMTGLESGAVRDVLDSLGQREIVVVIPSAPGTRWALTHTGKRMVR
jgi:DNA-binding MarR family transcriptional regulator